MEYLGAAHSVAKNLHAALSCPALKELCSVWGYESQLEDLERTVNTIKAVLLDAESKQSRVELSHQVQLWVEELKDAVYDADDLLDEFVTLAEQKQQRAKDEKGDGLLKKVRRFFSFDNPVLVALKMSRGIKEIRNKLDAIANDHNKFGFKFDSKPILMRREETCSYVKAPDVVGRKDDVDNIVAMLRDSNVQQDLSFLTIVGVGGLGKTTLAQLVFNDPRIKQEFSLRLWTCISDHEGKLFDIKANLVKIVQSTIGQKHYDLDMEHLQSKLREQLVGKKYLLVLDDVWNEDRHQWVELVKYLMHGARGSWIVVTTRSKETAKVVGGGPTYDLKGLSEEDSWHLFERAAFQQGYEPDDLVKIGHKIVKKCANVPLAIKVVGSLLYGQDKKAWSLFLENGLVGAAGGENGIEPILRLSYDNLESPLKICFSYCALFPKDYVIEKEILTSLWIAQNYVVPLKEGQSVDDASEEYFTILLRRCFFQDVKTNERDEIFSCKIHDLMHDIAQQVARKEIYSTNFVTSILDKKVRHLSHCHTSRDTIKCIFAKSKIRTYLQLNCWEKQLCMDMLLENWVCLRALSLTRSYIVNLPTTLGQLLHLRYLNLSYSYFKMLPTSITKLHNLQTLFLRGCSHLKELPTDLNKLAKLRALDIRDCWKLIDMPRGLGKLSCLQMLPMFVVAADTNPVQDVVDKLEDLKALSKLKGHLYIKMKTKKLREIVHVEENLREGGYVSSNQHLSSKHLNSIHIDFFPNSIKDYQKDYDEELMEGVQPHLIHFKLLEELEKALQPHPTLRKLEEELMEGLQPHPNLRELKLAGYSGERMPSWAREDNLATSLSNLVHLRLKSCDGLQCIASLRKLGSLKSLKVIGSLYSNELEYIEEGGVFESEPFFPSLEVLKLKNLPKLKGWCRENGIVDSNSSQQHIMPALSLPAFPRLSSLKILKCPHLKFIPPCPTVELLELGREHFGESDTIMRTRKCGSSKEGEIRTCQVGHLKLIASMDALQFVKEIQIRYDYEVKSLSEVEETFKGCSSSLRYLCISKCEYLESICGGLKHLTALEKLELWNLPKLNVNNATGERGGEEVDGIPWHCLQHTLRSLKLSNMFQLVNLPKEMCCLTALQSLDLGGLPKLVNLPKEICCLTALQSLKLIIVPGLVNLPEEIGCLTALQSLTIIRNWKLKSLPESIRKLTSLTHLTIDESTAELKERCQNPTGEDWPNIQHIPNISIT